MLTREIPRPCAPGMVDFVIGWSASDDASGQNQPFHHTIALLEQSASRQPKERDSGLQIHSSRGQKTRE